MSETSWEKKKKIFAAALVVAETERAKFLEHECADDLTLRREIEKLLDAHLTDESFIEKPAFQISSAFERDEAEKIGRHFGHYKIIREIGRGGMGAVFLAERDDGEFSQSVALKIVRQSIVDRETDRRFRQERQILASLNHPNIAKLLDGGVSENGELFLAMEFVEGVRIDEFCERENLPTDERLKLFLYVCRAVSFAHQNLIVHRDIKPSNILVSADGEPKLLDFGIAKLIDAEHAAEQTQTDYRAFTPEYAAPEQIAGERVTTATDVFSLGVLLAHLLQSPNSKAQSSSDRKTIQQKTKTEDRRPKTELDSILQMARREDAKRRYASVQQFAEDLERYLSGLPVLARRDSFGYRAKKFMRRNRLAVSAGALIAVLIVVGFAAVLWQANVARRERDRAEKRFADVRELSNALLTDIAPKIERLEGSTEARQSLVNQSLKYLDSLANESADADLQSELATAYEKIGDLQGDPTRPNLSDFSGAISSYEKANQIRRALPANDENESLLAKNFLRSSATRAFQNDVKNALADADESLKIYENLTAKNPASLWLEIDSLDAQIGEAQIYADNDQFKTAIPLFEKILAAIAAANNETKEIEMLKIKAGTFYANALSWDGRQAEAEREMTKTIEEAEKMLVEFQTDSGVRRQVWRTFSVTSSLYEIENNRLALAFAERALKLAQAAAAADGADTQAKQNLAKSFSRVGICSVLENRISDALEDFKKSEEILGELVKQEPKNTMYQKDFGRLYIRFGDFYRKRQDFQKALENYEKSVFYFEQIGIADEKNTLAKRDAAQSLKNVGEMFLKSGENEKARQTFQRAFDILTNLQAQNALGEFDRPMLDDVQKVLRKL
ncbi:MAG: protein kinase domain-containing protein [Pyrinomonadaceae bacterium]